MPNLGSRDQRPAIARLVGLLGLATQVFDDRPADLADLTDLRRLADIIRTASGAHVRDVTVADLMSEFRRAFLLLGTAAVTMPDLRELARLARLAKAAKGRVRRQVTRTDLIAHAMTASRVRDAERYLDADPERT